MFNRDLTIVQTGCTITRVIPRVCSGHCKLSDILLTVSWRASNHNIFIIVYTFFTSCLLRRKFMILYFHVFCTSYILFTSNTLHFVKLINHKSNQKICYIFLDVLLCTIECYSSKISDLWMREFLFDKYRFGISFVLHKVLSLCTDIDH